MTWWEAIILGIVEGLTEYLPVSSTGHLLMTQQLLGIGTESLEAEQAANAFAICIQAGAIIAVLGLYWRRVVQMTQGGLGLVGLTKKNEEGFKLGINIVVAFIPAAVIGLIFDEKIEELLFGVWPIVIAWFVGGVAILAVAWWRKKQKAAASGEEGDEGGDAGGESTEVGKTLESLTWQMALVIGLIQCIAMWPGTSRSLVTIVGGVLVGMRLGAAVEFSFLLGVITLCAATVYKAVLDSITVTLPDGTVQETMMVLWMAEEYGWFPMIIGSFAAWLSAVIAVKWMVEYLKKHGMEIFGYYRIAIAIVAAALVLGGILDADGAAESETIEVIPTSSIQLEHDGMLNIAWRD